MHRLAKYLKPYWIGLLASVALISVQAVCDLNLPAMMSGIVNAVVAASAASWSGVSGAGGAGVAGGAGGVSGAGGAGLASGAGGAPAQMQPILGTGAAMLLVTLAGGAATVLVSLISSWLASGVAHDIRRDLFYKVQSFSANEIDRFSTASLITRSTNDVTQIQIMLTMGIRLLCYAPIMAAGGLAMAMRTAPSMVWIIALGCGILSLLVAFVYFVAVPKFKAIQKLIDRLNLVTRENLAGLMVIRAFSAQKREKERFRAANGDLTGTHLFVSRVMATMFPIIMFMMNVFVLIIVWAGARGIAELKVNIGDVMAFIQYSMLVALGFLMISMMFVFVPRAAVASDRVAEVLHAPLTILDPPEPKRFRSLRRRGGGGSGSGGVERGKARGSARYKSRGRRGAKGTAKGIAGAGAGAGAGGAMAGAGAGGGAAAGVGSGAMAGAGAGVVAGAMAGAGAAAGAGTGAGAAATAGAGAGAAAEAGAGAGAAATAGARTSATAGAGAAASAAAGDAAACMGVEFDHVFFRYAGAEEYALQDVTFTARPGETTAVIGPTGSGKSTLASLILRFYDVTSGSLKVDGIDVREVSQRDLRARVGYVPQQGMLLSGTVATNLRYGSNEATDAELEDAAGVAQALEFIDDNEDGFDSEIAQGGANVSGGQKQRLSIARALVKKPDILVFDDSFSALDFATDRAVRKALRERTSGVTAIIIAQRVSTIMHADQIVVLNEGRVAGIGSHRELLAGCPQYWDIASSQLSQEELA